MIRNRVRWIAMLLTCVCMVSACELGVDPATRVSPNYHLLSACDADAARAEVVSIVEEALCGKIEVFEDRAAAGGRKIALNVMLLPATTSVVRPDPIFLLAGGPGQAAVEAGPFLFSRLKDLRRERDVVLVDQRGTGRSNSLACENTESVFEDLELTEAQLVDLSTDQMRQCLAGYDADPSLYTTPIAMDDLNEVRQVLGYEQINLIGISYGTRAGQVYLRRHEDTVRTLMLDAVVPMTLPVPLNVAFRL